MAAPVFSQIISGALRLLAIPPDALPEQVITSLASAGMPQVEVDQ